jgi:purine-binding chemotaxis protein CheW
MSQQETDDPTGPMDEDIIKRILKERAKILAKEGTHDDTSRNYHEILEFELASARFGFEVSEIREVYPLEHYTHIPCTPSFVFGIINVRGQIISIIDLKKFFKLPEKGITNLNRVIILDNGTMSFGLLADAIHGVRHVQIQEIHAVPAHISSIEAMYLSGMTEDGMVVLSSEKILADTKLVVNEEVRS